jgi:glucose-6-phosphate isomerase
MSKISIDYTFVLKEVIGEKGLTIDDINKYKEDINHSIDKITGMHEKGELSFLNLPSDIASVKEIENFVQSLNVEYENIIITGIGGSSLGVQAIYQSLLSFYHNINKKPQFFFLENVDPEIVAEFYDNIDLKRSVSIIITKSGSTAETMSQFMILKDRMEKSGADKISERIILITDPEKGDLLKIGKKEGYKIFHIPQNVGGRFSILTPIGLLSAELLGISSRKILNGANDIIKRITNKDIFKNPAAISAIILLEFYKRGRNIFVLFPYSSKLYLAADWFRQLWAESLGKRENLKGEIINWGQTPVKSLGVVDQHSQVQLYIEGPDDKIIGFMEVENKNGDIEIPEILKEFSATSYLGGHKISELIDSEKKGTEFALAKNGKPSFTYLFKDISPESIGAFFLLMEMQTAIAGEILGINTYNQPGVELGKKLTYGFLKREGYDLSLIDNLQKIERKKV